MENIESYDCKEITPINGCGIDDTSDIFYELGKHAFQEDSQEELEDIIDSEDTL